MTLKSVYRNEIHNWRQIKTCSITLPKLKGKLLILLQQKKDNAVIKTMIEKFDHKRKAIFFPEEQIAKIRNKIDHRNTTVKKTRCSFKIFKSAHCVIEK